VAEVQLYKRGIGNNVIEGVDGAADSARFVSLGLGIASPVSGLQIEGGSISIGDGGTTAAHLQMEQGQSSAVGGSDIGRIRYNSTTNQWEASENGVAYTAFVTGPGVAGGWTDDGAIVRLSTTADTLSIGATVMAGTEKVRIVGDLRVEGNLELTGFVDTSLRIEDGSGASDGVFLELAGGTDAAVSAADEMRFRYNQIDDVVEVSESTGAYHRLVPLANAATATVDTTTTSATDVLVNAMTLTPPAGTYAVSFTGSTDHSANNGAGQMSIYAGGVQVASSERGFMRGAGQGNVTVSFACTAIVTVDGVETIEGQWRTAASTFTMHERTLLIVEVRT
jgi:hypothetical protein